MRGRIASGSARKVLRFLLLSASGSLLVISPTRAQQTTGPQSPALSAGRDAIASYYCSPVVADTHTPGAAGLVVKINCNLTSSDVRKVASNNTELVLRSLRSVVYAKNEYLFPSIAGYIEAPTRAKWKVVVHDANAQLELIDAAIKSAVIYEASLEQPLSGTLKELHANLRKRVAELTSLLDLSADPLPTVAAVRQWAIEYSSLLAGLEREISALAGQLRIAGSPVSSSEKDSSGNYANPPPPLAPSQ